MIPFEILLTHVRQLANAHTDYNQGKPCTDLYVSTEIADRLSNGLSIVGGYGGLPPLRVDNVFGMKIHALSFLNDRTILVSHRELSVDELSTALAEAEKQFAE